MMLQNYSLPPFFQVVEEKKAHLFFNNLAFTVLLLLLPAAHPGSIHPDRNTNGHCEPHR